MTEKPLSSKVISVSHGYMTFKDKDVPSAVERFRKKRCLCSIFSKADIKSGMKCWICRELDEICGSFE